jgi:hypothetical protein
MFKVRLLTLVHTLSFFTGQDLAHHVENIFKRVKSWRWFQVGFID